MAAGPGTVVAGLAVGLAAVLGGPAPAQLPGAAPCAPAEQWERDAQALADQLAGATDAGAVALQQELTDNGFAPGAAAAPQPPADGLSGMLDDLVNALLSVFDTDRDGQISVTVIGPDGPVTPDACAPGG